MEERLVFQRIKAVYFIAAATMMYYFIDRVVHLPLYVSYPHAFAILIVCSGFVCFLVRPDAARFSVAVKSALVLSVPLLVMLTASLLIWCVEQTAPVQVFRGLSYYLVLTNQLTGALAAVTMLYVFGERGIWYNLAALVLANLLIDISVMLEYGVEVYFSQLWTLILTFADETGDVIINAEIHELAFCIGACLVYMLFHPRRDAFFWILLGLGGFCFLSAFKRIAMVAIACVLVIGYGLKLLQKRGMEKTAGRIITGILLAAVVLLTAYVAFVKLGAFTWLEEAGINTSGRADIYQKIDGLYTFSPTFLGRGQGYLTYYLNETVSLGMDTIHNDFLQLYIDLGFWGYILWLLAFTVLRTWYFGREGRSECALNTFVLLAYMLLVSSTDNTMNYFLVHVTLDILIAGYGFDLRVKEEERRLFGCISPESHPGRGPVPL